MQIKNHVMLSDAKFVVQNGSDDPDEYEACLELVKAEREARERAQQDDLRLMLAMAMPYVW